MKLARLFGRRFRPSAPAGVWVLLLALVLSDCATPDVAVARGTTWLEFELFRGSLIFVPGRVNGRPVDIVLDSGSSSVFLSEELARDLGLEGGHTHAGRAAAGTIRTRHVVGVDIEIGGRSLSNLDAHVVDLSVLESDLGKRVHVFLGRPLFDRFVVEIDYVNRRIAFHDPDGYFYAGAGRTASLEPTSGGWLVEAVVEGFAPSSYLLDTGDMNVITLFDIAEYRWRRMLADGRPWTTVTGFGLGDQVPVGELATVGRVAVAGFELRDVPVEFAAEDDRATWSSSLGALGNRLLERFDVVIDAPHGRLHLQTTDHTHRPFTKNRSGLVVQRVESSLRVSAVLPGSPAEHGGWAVGELITAIDGVPVGVAYWDGEHRWGMAPAGTRVVLSQGVDETREIVLADFY
jgi:hypothetical protein